MLGVAIAFLVSTLSAGDAFSQDIGGAPSRWRSVPSSEKMNSLDMLADQMKGNYERIRTWEGEYHVEAEDLLSARQLAFAVTDNTEVAKNGIIQRVESTMQFVVDFEANATYWCRVDPKLSWLRPDSRKSVSIPGARVTAQRSVFSGEDYLHFDPTNLVPELADLPGNPAAQNKRVAYKDSIEGVAKQRYRDLLDPRLFFGVGVPKSYWDYFGQLKAQAGRLGDRLKVFQADGPGGPWYRFSLSLQGGGIEMMTFSPEAQFNPVRRVMTRVITDDDAGEKVLQDVQWQWKRFGDIYLPAEVKIVDNVRGSKTPTNILNVKLGKCVLNKPVDPQQFTYKALGLKDGDLVMDRVNRQFLIQDNGKLVKLASFGERYVPPGSSLSAAMSTTRWVLVVFSIVLLAIAVTALVIRRVRSRNA